MDAERRAPWCLRLAERAGWSSPRVSLAVAGGLLAAFVGAEWSLGRLAVIAREAHAAADFQVALGLIALVAYLPGAFAAAVRGAERTLAELAPAFARAEDAAAALARVEGRRESPYLRRLGVAGAAVALAMPLAANLTPASWILWELPPEALAHRALLGPLGWFAGRFAGQVGRESRRLAALGADALRVDLLDLRPLAPLSRAGLRHALLGAGALGLLLAGFSDPSVAPGLPFVVAVASLASLSLSGVALWLALRGGRDAIAREKARAQAAADAQIRGLRSVGSRHEAGALADALAWKRFVAEAPDWPIDAPTLQRFVIPLALPLASLLAGAFLDGVFSRLLGD